MEQGVVGDLLHIATYSVSQTHSFFSLHSLLRNQEAYLALRVEMALVRREQT